MATELHLTHNPMHGIKRHIKEMKSSNDAHEALLRAVIESNVHTQQAVSEVSKSIGDFVTLLKSANEEEPKEPKQPKAEVQKISVIEQKLDKIAMQNFQLIQAISELIKYLKKDKGVPQQPQYAGIYPMRQVQ